MTNSINNNEAWQTDSVVKMSTSQVHKKMNLERSKDALSAISDRTVYSIPKRTSANIVDLVLRIMDGDGPRPMRNLRPVKKTRTGAEQFYVEHHAEYEARGQPSRDKVGRVHTHNSAYPKMYDELNKRKTTAQPEAYINNTANQNVVPLPKNFDPNCRSVCVKLKRQATVDGRKRKKHKRSRHRRTYETESNSRQIKTKISKSKRPKRRYRSPSGVYKLSKLWMNKGCQCTCYYLPAETKSVATFNDDLLSSQPEVTPAQNIQKCYENNYEIKNVMSPIQPDIIIRRKPSKSVNESANPETNSAPSISTYNSFMSMEHEPMVE